MNSKKCLELAILEYEKETIDDENNQWVKNVLKGLKQIKQDLEILEILKNNITIEKCYAYEILGINLTNIDEDFKKVKGWLESE